MPDESKAGDATPASKKAGAASLQQKNVSDGRKLIADARALESEKVEQERKTLLSIFQREAAELGSPISVEWPDLPTPEPGAKAPKKTRGEVVAKYRSSQNWANMVGPRPATFMDQRQKSGGF